MQRWQRLFALIWVALCSSISMAATAEEQEQDQPNRVYLATMAPGDQFWSVFGHNALLLEYPNPIGGVLQLRFLRFH